MEYSTVAVVRGKGVLSPKREINHKKLVKIYARGFQLLTDESSQSKNLSFFFSRKDRIGIKINTIAGRKLTSLPEVTLSLAKMLRDNGFSERNIYIWDRTNRELRDAGYSLNLGGSGFRIFGTDTEGVGYSSGLISHLNVGSIFSAIQSSIISASISFAILKDHGLAGVTAGMKNYFGAIHNPNKYHDSNCNPFIAELFDVKMIREKHRLSIIDALVIQYHRGPSFHSQWAERMETLIFSTDPIAADVVAWNIIEKLRKKKGLPTLKEEGREPTYLSTAEKMGLGKASPESIKIIEEEV